jgi:anti-sigma-K factor RskA
MRRRELAKRLAEQQRAVALIRSAGAGVEAPASLRARVEAQRLGARPRRRLPVLAGASAVAALAAAGLLVFGLGSSPERYHAALAGPEAHGEATFMRTSSGWRIDLDASGLPRRAGGRYYEAWLRDRAGRRVAVGTFNEAHAVTLWAGVSPKVFSTLSVTREPADGAKVLSGTMPESS